MNLSFETSLMRTKSNIFFEFFFLLELEQKDKIYLMRHNRQYALV